MERRDHLPAVVAGRYAVFDPIATGGMATVCFGRLVGPKGFARTVVIKRLHPQFVGDADSSAMFLDEARVAARVNHPNVVPVIDVVEGGGEILLVMDYVHGESLAFLAREERSRDVARIRILANVVASALHGLHAAHEATGDNGRPLGIVHRDVSPQNILVGADGGARVVDFGVAKAAGQSHSTGVGQVKGKIRYLAPEQVMGKVDRRTDVWAAAVVLWEALTQKRLFSGDSEGAVMMEILHKQIPSPRAFTPDVPEALAAVALRGLARDVDARFPTALAMAEAIEAAVGLVSTREIGAWVARVAADRLAARRRLLDDIEAETLGGPGEGARPSVPEPRRPQAPVDMVATPVPATPTVPPPPLAQASSRRSSRRLPAAAAIAVLAVLAALVTRSIVGTPVPHASPATAIAAPPPVLTPERPVATVSAPQDPPPPASVTVPMPSASAPAPMPRYRPPVTKPRQADFKVPLYGRD
jgi:serine/threonine-protein kinase